MQNRQHIVETADRRVSFQSNSKSFEKYYGDCSYYSLQVRSAMSRIINNNAIKYFTCQLKIIVLALPPMSS